MGDDTTALADTIDDEGPVDTTIIGRNAYRSYFSLVRRPDSLQQVLGQFGAWLRERKAIDIDLHVSRRDTVGATTLTVAHNDKADGHQVRCVLVEDRTRESWRTELTVFVPARAGRGWVNLVASSDQGTPAKPPNVFAQIVDVLHEPRDGALPLRSQPPVIGMSQVDDLVAWIGDPERHALLLVAGTGDQLDFGPWVEKVRYWADDMKGMAQTVVLDPPTTIRLAELVGPSHAVSPWTIRTFRPAAQITDPQDGPRHRVLSTGRMATSEDREIRQLLARVARRHANDRATPVSLARTTRDLDRVTTALLLDRIFEPEPVPAETVQLAEPANPAVAPYVPEPTVADDDVVELQALVADQARRLADVAAVLGPNWTASSVRGWQGLDNEHRNLTQRYSRDREILLRSRTQLEQSLTEVDDLRADVENLRGQLRTEEEERTLAELLRVQAEDETRWLRDQFRAQQEYELATATMPKDRETDIPSSFDELAVRLPELGGPASSSPEMSTSCGGSPVGVGVDGRALQAREGRDAEPAHALPRRLPVHRPGVRGLHRAAPAGRHHELRATHDVDEARSWTAGDAPPDRSRYDPPVGGERWTRCAPCRPAPPCPGRPRPPPERPGRHDHGEPAARVVEQALAVEAGHDPPLQGVLVEPARNGRLAHVRLGLQQAGDHRRGEVADLLGRRLDTGDPLFAWENPTRQPASTPESPAASRIVSRVSARSPRPCGAVVVPPRSGHARGVVELGVSLLPRHATLNVHTGKASS